MSAETVRRCLNCEKELAGPYCSACGQKDSPPLPRLAELFADVYEEVFKLDGKIWASLRLIFTRPGALTLAYAQGRKCSYVQPFKLYLVAAFFVVLAMQTSGGVTSTDKLPWEDNALSRGLQQGTAFFFDNVTVVSAAMSPLAALAYVVLFRRRRQPFVLHMVAALHNWAGQALWSIPLVLMAALVLPVGERSAAMALLASLALWSYQAVAFRRIYGSGLVASVFQSMVAMLWSFFTSMVAMLVILVGFVVVEVARSGKPLR